MRQWAGVEQQPWHGMTCSMLIDGSHIHMGRTMAWALD